MSKINKFASISDYDYPINRSYKMHPAHEDLLIYYVCYYSNNYLKFLVLSLETFLKHSDICDFHVKVYLQDKLTNAKELEILNDWKVPIEICYDERFVSKFSIPYREENQKFSKFLCLDCDTFCYSYPNLFETVNNIQSPLASPLPPPGKNIYNNTCRQELIFRQFQSVTFEGLDEHCYLDMVKFFVQYHKKDGELFLNRMRWNWGWFSYYNRDLLDSIKLWKDVFHFVDDTLKTSCDETLFMLMDCLSPGIFEDLRPKINFLAGEEFNYFSKEPKSAVLHPVWGHVCEMKTELQSFFDFLLV